MPFHVYVHITWTTLDRRHLIDGQIAGFLERMIPAVAGRHGAQMLQLGMVADHVHVVLELPQHLDIPRLVQGLKGASARIANRDGIASTRPLRWAKGYDLRSVSPGDLEQTRAYVRDQSLRHPERVVR